MSRYHSSAHANLARGQLADASHRGGAEQGSGRDDDGGGGVQPLAQSAGLGRRAGDVTEFVAERGPLVNLDQ